MVDDKDKDPAQKPPAQPQAAPAAKPATGAPPVKSSAPPSKTAAPSTKTAATPSKPAATATAAKAKPVSSAAAGKPAGDPQKKAAAPVKKAAADAEAKAAGEAPKKKRQPVPEAEADGEEEESEDDEDADETPPPQRSKTASHLSAPFVFIGAIVGFILVASAPIVYVNEILQYFKKDSQWPGWTALDGLNYAFFDSRLYFYGQHLFMKGVKAPLIDFRFSPELTRYANLVVFHVLDSSVILVSLITGGILMYSSIRAALLTQKN